MEVRSRESKRSQEQASLIQKIAKKNHNKENFPRTNHLGWKYIRGESITKYEFGKFIKILYKALFYSLNNLKGPSQQYLSKKKLWLPQPKGSSKKILLLDLDQTLIHSVKQNQTADITLGKGIRFNIRPYCFQFLREMSKLFNIYIFTASTQSYATPVISYLNSKVNSILGVLHRNHCMQTQNGLYIKDLRIIQNRNLKDIIMIDNLMHSFGLQPHNGIPILQFKNNYEDRELLELIPLLARLNSHHDSQNFLRNHLKLTQILEISEAEFTTFSNQDIRNS